jgi:repressor LexA
MIEDLINDGDIVLIEQRHTVDNGATVVAWLKEQKETTLKRYYREGPMVRLQPANSTLSPRFVPASNVEVQGRVVGVLRFLA